MKRTTVMCLAILLGIGCGCIGVWIGGSISYPEAPILVDGDAIRASMLDAALLNTQAWLLSSIKPIRWESPDQGLIDPIKYEIDLEIYESDND